MLTAASQFHSDKKQPIVLMGVAGCGKSAVGAALALRLGVNYVDGDDLHPVENIKKMSQGVALTDDDRWPWLHAVGETLDKSSNRFILGCSALKRSYRDYIRRVADTLIVFIHLSGSKELITERMAKRAEHFMPTTLIDSQFAALEAPAPDENAITINIEMPLDVIVSEIVAALAKRSL